MESGLEVVQLISEVANVTNFVSCCLMLFYAYALNIATLKLDDVFILIVCG